MPTTHLVVDGSNIATEGRSLPSLSQLLDAVDAVAKEHPGATVTVIVDATFGHRIDASERPAYEERIDRGEIITPPAGVIGRGDAFILEVADRASAVILSNDSFQEFHADYEWLFEYGAHFFLYLTLFIGLFDEDWAKERGPLSYQLAWAKRLQGWTGKPYPSIAL